MNIYDKGVLLRLIVPKSFLTSTKSLTILYLSHIL